MASSFNVPCPSCENGVLVKSKGMIGKKIDCPKCKYRFTVPDPNLDEGDDSAPVEAAPKKSKKKKGNAKVLVGVGLGVLAVGLLAVGAIFLFGEDDTPKPAPVIPRPQVAQVTPQPSPDGSPMTSGDQTGTDPMTPMGTGTDVDPTTPPPVAPGVGAEFGLPGAKSNKPVSKKPVQDKPVPPGKLKDPTNLLPGQTSVVMRINMERVLQTPLYNAVFDRAILDSFRTSMTFDATEITTVMVSMVDPDRDPFVVIRTRSPISSRTMLGTLDLEPGPQNGGQIQGRDYFVIKSNGFLNAISRALSTESLLGEAGIPVTDEDKKRWKEKPLGLNIYDSQTLIIAEVGILERYLIDLDKNGDPPFVTALTPPDAAPKPSSGESGPGGPGGPGGAEGPGGPGAPTPMGPGGPMRMSGGVGVGPMGPGGPGGPGAETPDESGPGGTPPRPKPKLYTSIPTYRTVKSELKFLMNRLEEDEKEPPALVYAEILDQRVYARDLSAFEQFGLLMRAIVQNVRMFGVALTTLNREKVTGQLVFQYVSSEDAKKSVNDNIVPLLNLLRIPLGTLLGSQIQVRTGGAGGQSGGFPGGPGGEISPEGGEAFGGPGGGQGNATAPPPPGEPAGPSPGVPGGPGGRGGPGGPGGFEGGFGSQPSTGDLSAIDVALSDSVATVNFNITWNADRYAKVVQSAIAELGEQLRGRMGVLSGETDYHTLAASFKKILQTRQAFPNGTLPRTSSPERYGLPYPPDQRASFLVELLPFIGQGGLRGRIDDKKYAWYAKENLPAAQKWVPEFLVPYYPQSSWRASHPLAPGKALGATNYVGISGIGLDSARYNPTDPNQAKLVGITGYEWGSKPAQITDGMSNTIYMMQVPPGLTRPWIAGGGATVQGIDDKAVNPLADFVHRTPEGKRGTFALMADGSVRWLPEDLDPKVFKALVTRAGGESLKDLDKLAPIEKGRDIELSNRPGEEATPAPKPKPDDELSPEARAELNKLQGRWAATLMVSPKATLTEDQLKVLKAIVEIEDRRITITLNSKVVSILEIIKIDPKTSPKVLEVKYLQGPEDKIGNSEMSVYEIVGDNVLRMRSTPDGKELPKSVARPESGSEDEYQEMKKIME